MKNAIASNYLILISFIVFVVFNSGHSSQPTIDIITKVKNPEHYDSLARNHYILKELFSNWEIKSVSTPLEQKKLVSFYLDLLAPKSVVPNSASFEFGLSMKFFGDSLINIEEIKSVRKGLKIDLENIEKNKFIRTFRCNSNIESEYLFWSGAGYKYQIRSDSGDTLEIFPGWPSSPVGEWVSWFNFNSPNLLEVLETYLNNLFPISQILSFRSKVGIGHARKRGSILQISSGSNCEGTDVCLTIYHSGQWITGYKLPLNSDWSDFPYFSDAVREVNYFLLTQGQTDCFSNILPPYVPFAIMCHQQNTLPRRVYMPIMCKNKLLKIVSVQIDNEGSKNPDPIMHEVSILDSLLTEFQWDKFSEQ